MLLEFIEYKETMEEVSIFPIGMDEILKEILLALTFEIFKKDGWTAHGLLHQSDYIIENYSVAIFQKIVGKILRLFRKVGDDVRIIVWKCSYMLRSYGVDNFLELLHVILIIAQKDRIIATKMISELTYILDKVIGFNRNYILHLVIVLRKLATIDAKMAYNLFESAPKSLKNLSILRVLVFLRDLVLDAIQ